MLKRLRKKIKQQQIKNYKIAAITVCTALALSTQLPVAWAAGEQNFSDGNPHAISGDISVTSGDGLDVSGTNTTATMIGGNITATGLANNGASATNSGSINLTNVTIGAGTNGSWFNGLYANNGNISMTGGSIALLRYNGAWSYTAGSIQLNNVSITIGTSASAVYGLWTNSSSGNITMNGGIAGAGTCDTHPRSTIRCHTVGSCCSAGRYSL